MPGTACDGYLPAPPGTIVHGQQAAGDLRVRVLAGFAAGLGMRAPARGFAVAPNTVWHWRVEAAEPRWALARYCRCEGHVTQGPLDAVYAVLRDLKAGASRDDEAMKRRERSSCWGWSAMAPERHWLVVIDVGTRPWEMAQRVGQQVAPVVAPGGMPLVLPDGLQEYGTALLAPFGSGRQAERRRDQGPRHNRAGCRGLSCSRRQW